MHIRYEFSGLKFWYSYLFLSAVNLLDFLYYFREILLTLLYWISILVLIFLISKTFFLCFFIISFSVQNTKYLQMDVILSTYSLISLNNYIYLKIFCLHDLVSYIIFIQFLFFNYLFILEGFIQIFVIFDCLLILRMRKYLHTWTASAKVAVLCTDDKRVGETAEVW